MKGVIKGVPLSGKVRFRPCYGIAVTKTTPTSVPYGWSEVISMLRTCPAIGLVQIRYPWSDLETSLGNYDGNSWAQIQADLDQLKFSASEGGWRKVSIVIDTKRFDWIYDLVPSYMLDDPFTGTYGGGQLDFGVLDGFSNGRNIRFENANVRERFKALIREFGRRFKNESQIEFITFNEATPGGPIMNGVPYNEDGHFAGILECLSEFKKAMPYTMIRQIYNYSRPGINTFVPNFVAAGLHAGGGADTVPDEPGLGINTPYWGAYQWHQFYGGKGGNNIAIVAEVQNENYPFTNLLNVVKPDPAWGTLTLANNGSGGLQLQGSGIHGMTVGNVVDTVNASAGFQVKTAAGNFPVGYLNILSVDSTQNVTVTNRAAWTTPAVIGAGQLNYANAISAGLTDPSAGIVKAGVGGYPYGSGFDWDPRPSTATGFVPLISELIDFIKIDLKATHVIFTYNTSINTRTNRRNIDNVIDYLNGITATNKPNTNLFTTRPLNLL